MKKLLFICFGILWAWSVCAQEPKETLCQDITECWQKADSLRKARNYTGALAVDKLIVKILQSRSVIPYDSLILTYIELGTNYWSNGESAQSLKHYETALNICQKYLPEDAETLGKCYQALGLYHTYQKNHAESESYLLKSIALGKTVKNNFLNRSYQRLGHLYQSMGKYDLAIENYEKLTEEYKKTHATDDLEFSDLYQNIGTIHHIQGNLMEALAYYDLAVSIYKKHLADNHKDFGGIYNNMAFAYTQLGNYPVAKKYFKKAINNYHQNTNGEQANLSKIYSSYGGFLYEIGDYNQALIYFERVLALREKIYDTEHPQIARVKNQIGNCYLVKNKLEEAEKWMMEALAIRERNREKSKSELADSYQDVGKLYEQYGYWERALQEYEKAININRTAFAKKQHPTLAENYFLVGNLLLKQHKFDEARSWLEESLKQYRALYGERHPEVARLYIYLAATFKEEEAAASQMIINSLNAINLENNGDLDAYSAPKVLLKILEIKGKLETDFAVKNNSLQQLKNASINHDLALQLIDTIKITYPESGSKQALIDNFFKVYENAIAANCALQAKTKDKKYWRKAFEIAEKSNGTLLMEALNSVKATAFSGIPKRLVEREDKLKTEIGFYEKIKFEEQQKGESGDVATLKKANNELFNLKRAHQEVIQTFIDSFPDFYHLKYAEELVTVETLQKEVLTEQQVMMEYFVGEEKIYLFVIAKDDFEVIEIAKDFPFEVWIEELRTGIYFYNPLRKDAEYLVQKYANIAYELYEILIAPAQDLIAQKDLVIIPGGILGYLPFEALLSAEANAQMPFADYPYLLKDYNISYNYSARLWYDLLQQEPETGGKECFLGFAPQFAGDTVAINRSGVLNPLLYNQEEVTYINQLFDGDIFTDAKATLANFLDKAARYRILHLATHGVANDRVGDYSYLAFYQTPDSTDQNILYVKDIYDLKLNAEMVVLSACETAVGEYQRGEGIVSLARGFFYAGTESILTTLWKLDDKASLQMMQKFYQNYKSEMPKAAALRQAKLDFIAEQSSFHAHPLYWAAFVSVGNMSPYVPSTDWFLWIIGIAFCICLFWGIKKALMKASRA